MASRSFFRESLTAVVFDDAHAAEHLIRDHFTLKISRSTFPALFTQMAQLFRSYHDRIGKAVGYSETLDSSDPNTSWFIPPFAVHEQLSEIQRFLISENLSLSGKLETMFAWEHLKDHIDLCACFVTGAEFSFTPAVVPVGILPYFQKHVHRLYLSATMPAGDAFFRTFGREVELTIAPTTTAGECERLILIPALNKACNDEGDLEIAKKIIATQKTLILVPSDSVAARWQDTATFDPNADVTQQVELFKSASPPEKLLLVARFDGLDLPGDTCRVMAIDGLPTGVGQLERFLWEKLGMARVLRSTVASRVIQSFGRIFRGMSDHGVVVVTGKKLVDWLLTPTNRKVLPEFLSRQLELGIEISRQAGSVQEFVDAAQQSLNRDPGWVKYYQDNMQIAGTPGPQTAADDELKIAKAQVEFGHLLWARDYAKAAKRLHGVLDDLFTISSAAGAWSALWLGYSYELMGDVPSARTLYGRAHGGAKNIPAFEVQITPPLNQYSEQVMEVARYLDCSSQGFTQLLARFDAEVSALKAPGATVPQVEGAIRSLGEYLGLDSTRPEKEHGTGPDDLWFSPGEPALCIEAKNDKTSAQFYWKKDVAQMSDHIQWVKENTDASEIIPAFAGPVLPAAADSNPLPEIVLIELAELSAIADRLRGALSDIQKTALPLTLRQDVDELFAIRGLKWPTLSLQLKKRALKRFK
jgi:hypothetical protein